MIELLVVLGTVAEERCGSRTRQNERRRERGHHATTRAAPASGYHESECYTEGLSPQ